MSIPPLGVWLKARTKLTEGYPCLCDRRGCQPNWCPCAGRKDLESAPQGCCAWRFTPEVVARAIHGGDYRTCWCKGQIERHRTEAPAAGLMDMIEEEDDE